MDAADPACRQHADARRAANGERPTDRRRADRALCDADRQVARAYLACSDIEPLELLAREPDADLAVEHTDRRRHRAGGADSIVRLLCDGDPLTRREAVRDERRLERDDGLRVAHLVRDADHGIAPTCATQRAAASAASSAPPTRKPAASASPAPVVSTTDTSRAWHTSIKSPRATSKPSAPRLITAVAKNGPTASHSASLPKTTSGASASSCSRNRAAPYDLIRVHAERSTLTRAPAARASSAA